jgi:Fungal Zn(2)-Cys(6) binuclear cluster domain
MDEQGQLPKKRAACDRCHDQKLRCPRPLMGGSCSRCLKADVPCAFSISKRGNGWRILSQQPGISDPSLSGSLSADAMILDYSGFDLTSNVEFDPGFANAALSSQLPLNDGTHLLEPYLESDMLRTYDQTMATPLPTVEFCSPTISRVATTPLEFQQTSSGNSMPALINSSAIESVSGVSVQSHEKDARDQSIDLRLLVLSKDLLDHRSLIREPSIHRDGLTFSAPTQKEKQHGQLSTSDMNGLKTNSEKFSLDKTLLLTQRLLDIYTDLIAAVNSHLTQQKALADKTLNYVGASTSSSSSTQDIVDSAKFSSSAVEQSTVLLILSCHHRIVHIWELVCIHGTELIKYGLFKSPDWSEKKKCGDIKFGSFAPHSAALLNAATMPLIANTISSLEKSLQQLSQCIQTDSTNWVLGFESNQQHEESMADSDPLSNNPGSLSSLIPTCDKTLGLSRQLIQILDRSKTIFLEAGLLE